MLTFLAVQGTVTHAARPQHHSITSWARRRQRGSKRLGNSATWAMHINSSARPRSGRSTTKMVGIDGQRRAGAFQAARIRRPSIEYSGVVSPQARTVGQLTCSGFVKFRPPCSFSLTTIQVAQQCCPFATYRRVSCPFASTICRCITACSGRQPSRT
jgi:hypothetical protein